MTRNPVHVSRTSPVVEATALMLKKRIDCLLVYDDPKELQGIVTARDFLKVLLLYLQALVHDGKTFRLADMGRGLSTKDIFQYGARCVKDVMSRTVITLDADSSVQEAIKLIQKHEVRHIPIVNEEQRCIYVITDCDILKALPPQNKRREKTDGEQFREWLFSVDSTESLLTEKVSFTRLQDQKPINVALDTTLKDAITTLLDRDMSGLPVLDQSRRICGMFTSTDVLHVAWAAFRFVDQTV